MRQTIIEPNIKYSRIGESRRTKLIDLVIRQGYKTVRASKMLKINQSTAKSILKLYRQTGTYSAKPKIDREASNKTKNTQTNEKLQQMNINGNNKTEQKEQIKAGTELLETNLYQSQYCTYPTYFPPFYVVFSNIEHQK